MSSTSPAQIPVAERNSLYCTLYHRAPGYGALAEAALGALGGGSSPEPGVWLSPIPIRWATCGYGIVGGRQLAFASTLELLEEELRALRLEATRFSIEARCLPRGRKGTIAAKTRIADCIAGDVSVNDPQLRLLVVMSSLGYRVLVEADAEPQEGGWLGVSQKPHNYLVAVPVRLAKAMLNLTARPGDVVLDPFCGSGTIPLLAAWAGHRAFGSDISAACVAHAGENLAHFGYEATLVCIDAGVTRQTADCIVSNLPYGLYSHFASGARQDVLRNLGRLAPRVTLVTSERLDDDLRAAGYEVLQIIPVGPERFQRLVYITRTSSAPVDAIGELGPSHPSRIG